MVLFGILDEQHFVILTFFLFFKEKRTYKKHKNATKYKIPIYLQTHYYTLSTAKIPIHITLSN